MKKLILALIVSSIATVAFAQTPSTPWRNDAAATTLQGTNLQPGKASVTAQGSSFLAAGITGGCTMYYYNGLVGAIQQIKGTIGTICGYMIGNTAGTECYLQIFDVAAATTPSLGSTVPTNSWPFPTGASANVPATAPGIAFVNGLKIAATTTAGGATPCGTGMIINIWYK